MATFVPGFLKDVFISYAQVAEPEWVRQFVVSLQKHLDRELGGTASASIFWDRADLDGAAPLTAEITQAVTGSAV
jgi:hypothetical protein